MQFINIYISNSSNLINIKYVNKADFSLIRLYISKITYISQLKIKILENYLNILLSFNISIINEKVNIRTRRLYFSDSIKSFFKFTNKTVLLLLKSFSYIYLKISNNFFFNFNLSHIKSYQPNLLLNTFMLPKFKYTKFSNEIKFLPFILSKNKDFLLTNILSYKKFLIRKDFITAFYYIISNNLTKFFKSTKLEKNFIVVHLTLKFFIYYFLKNTIFNTKFKILDNIFYKLKKKNQILFFKNSIINFSLNYFINYNIQV